MKNIEAKHIVELTKEVEKYKKLRGIYNHVETVWDREDDYKDSYELYKTLDSEIQDSIDGISQWLGDLFDDWAGFRWNKEQTFESRDAYFEWVDAETERYEAIDGSCEDVVGVNDYVYSGIRCIPKVFMKEFIKEYGLFKIDDNGDVWVI